MDKRPDTVADIEQAIRRYLQAHPHAVDTQRGISEWWLRDCLPMCESGDLQAAIERLVAAHELEQLALPDGQLAYAVPKTTDPRPQGQP